MTVQEITALQGRVAVDRWDGRELHVAHLISNLGYGGAENSLCTLVEATEGQELRHTVISMLPCGAFADRLDAAGVRVIELEGRRGLLGALGAGAIAGAIAATGADLVQCWMYHANVAASALQMTGRLRLPVLWGVRQGLETLKFERESTRALIVGGAPLSRLARHIVYNSEQAALDHERIGYRGAARIVIANGTDCDRFTPRTGAKAALCKAIGVPPDAELVGRVARFSPMKDFATLTEAFAIVAGERPKAWLVVIGPTEGDEQRQFYALAEAQGCRDRVIALPHRRDIENFYAGVDVAVSSSVANEGFPNSVAEALASGVLVVSTMIGSEKLIRDGCHRVVEPRDPARLAAGIVELLSLDPSRRADLAKRGRNFVQQSFGVPNFTSAFTDLWKQVTAQQRAASRRAV